MIRQHGKKFAEISQNLVRYRSEINNFIRNYQNNYVGCSSWLLECHNFLRHCLSCLDFLHNYFDDSTKLFSDLYLLKKLLDSSANSSVKDFKEPVCGREAFKSQGSANM